LLASKTLRTAGMPRSFCRGRAWSLATRPMCHAAARRSAPWLSPGPRPSTALATAACACRRPALPAEHAAPAAAACPWRMQRCRPSCTACKHLGYVCQPCACRGWSAPRARSARCAPQRLACPYQQARAVWGTTLQWGACRHLRVRRGACHTACAAGRAPPGARSRRPAARAAACRPG